MSGAEPVAAFLRAAAELCRATDGILIRNGLTLAGASNEPIARTHESPLRDLSGESFAVLRSRLPADVDPLVRLLHTAREAEGAARAEGETPLDGEQDPVTGLGRTALWERFLAAEWQRCQVFAHPCTVLVADIPRTTHGSDPDGAARRAQRAAQGLRRSLRGQDLLCRLNPTLFGVLAIECAGQVADQVGTRVRDGLLDAGLAAAIGTAGYDPAGGRHAAQVTDAAGTRGGPLAGLLDEAIERLRADRERQRVVPL